MYYAFFVSGIGVNDYAIRPLLNDGRGLSRRQKNNELEEKIQYNDYQYIKS
jgi:hypothetical protein